MKIKSAIFAVSMLAALSGSAANFVFHGTVSGDMLDVANWYEVSGTPDVWGIPMNGKDDYWTFSPATRLPTDGDTVGIARYYYGTDRSQILLPPSDKYIGVSASIGKVVIGEGSWLGENVCVLGAKIGKHCVIGANSVVTKDIPANSIAYGNPCRVARQV